MKKAIGLDVFAVKLLPKEELFTRGHRACQGCGPAIALRHIAKALGRNTIVVNATGCMEIIASPYPHSAWELPWIHVAFENTAAVASGIESGIKALKRKGKRFTDKGKIAVLAIAGDGGTSDIGLQALSGALERGHDFIYICYDNEAYMNTGIQRSSATPYGASTTTSPAGRVIKGQVTWKKNMAAIAAAHDIPYVATATVAYPLDLYEKVKKANRVNGPAYLHILAPCPTGWRLAPNLCVKASRLAVETGIFPLFEVIDGEWILNYDPPELVDVREYLKLQGRFRHLTEEQIDYIQKRVRRDFERLKKMCKFLGAK